MMRSSLALLACVALTSGCGDQAEVMESCLAATPEFAARLGSALQDCGQVDTSYISLLIIYPEFICRCLEVKTGLD